MQPRRLHYGLFVLSTLWAYLAPGPLASARAADDGFLAGTARHVITPSKLLWMAGYGARDKPAEGKQQDLYVKALALQDPAGAKLVLLTSDLVGLPRSLSTAVADEIERQTGLRREQMLLTCSHTHCGPVVRGSLSDMYPLSAEQWRDVDEYTQQLHGWMVATVQAALADLKPAHLSYGKGTARFAANRRKPTPHGIINDLNPGGPVDHDVPVLRVETPDGKLRAVVFGYACHNTTLSFYRWCGDYAGYAQQDLEKKYPGATALFWIGCGADANPLPRGTVALCEKYGRELADAVSGVLDGPMQPVRGRFREAYAEITLPLDRLPPREKFAADLLSKIPAERRRAERLLNILDGGGKIDDSYAHYPVQVWRLGSDLLWVALGGEVVVDYDLRLKKELGGNHPLWITAYSNDVMAYIPSVRVLKEGGYEADSSMIYYGMPTRWAPAIEDRIIGKVHDLVPATSH
jgi:Neutral/alkaline non-lysosomal ceramidase, N-terminal